MDKTTAALLLIGIVHVLGAVLLFALLFERRELRSWWPRDERGGDDPPSGPPPLPLPSGDPADVRLRTEHDQLGRRRRRARSAPEAPREPTRGAPAAR